jgi:5-methylcytosine-specific restriction enzyme subunit McrC
MFPRTLRLTEYRPREVRLRRADVDALLAAGPAFEVIPTRERHRYRVTAQGVAGVLITPNLRVVVRPKIPTANLFLLLDPEAPPDVVADTSSPETGTEAIDFLARRLADGMRARAATGLRHGYVERSDQQPFLQGRLDVVAQARESPAARDRFHVTREEFSADTVLHRLVKATAEALGASPFVSPTARTALRTALGGYAQVSSVLFDPAAFDDRRLDRLAEPDRPLLDLCRLVARAIRPGERPGDAAGPAFLLELERVFERYVERGLRAGLGSDRLEVQRDFCYHAPVPAGQPPLTGRPDFVLRRDGTVVRVLDAKWKALDGPPPAADVHQAIAYAAGLGCRDVRLVYPGRRGATWRYALTENDVTLTIHTLRVVGPRERCDRSVQNLRRGLTSNEVR